jgi:hypothetical protein
MSVPNAECQQRMGTLWSFPAQIDWHDCAANVMPAESLLAITGTMDGSETSVLFHASSTLAPRHVVYEDIDADALGLRILVHELCFLGRERIFPVCAGGLLPPRRLCSYRSSRKTQVVGILLLALKQCG